MKSDINIKCDKYTDYDKYTNNTLFNQFKNKLINKYNYIYIKYYK